MYRTHLDTLVQKVNKMVSNNHVIIPMCHAHVLCTIEAIFGAYE